VLTNIGHFNDIPPLQNASSQDAGSNLTEEQPFQNSGKPSDEMPAAQDEGSPYW
jgi:hypothetical protein